MKYIIPLILLLSSCATQPLQIHTKAVTKPKLILPKVDKLVLYDITPHIIKTKDGIIVGFTGSDWKKAILNNKNKLKLCRQLKAQVEAYKEFYK